MGWRVGAAALVPLVMLALAAGCGGGSAPAASSPAPAPPATQASAAPGASASAPTRHLQTVVIDKAVNVVTFDVADIAAHEGFFAQHGVAAKLDVVAGSTVANSSLTGGSAQFSLAGSLPFLLARSKGLPLISVGALDEGVGLELIVSNRWIAAHHLSPTQPLNDKLRGLEGSTFGQIGPTDLTYFDYMLRGAGVPTSSVKVVHLGSSSAAVAALQRGEIDEFQLSPPASLQVQAQGQGRVLLDYKSIPAFRDLVFNVLTTTASYAKAHPAVVRAVATAMAQGNDFVAAHPNQSLAIVEKLWPQLTPAVLRASLQHLTYARDGMQSAALWRNAEAVARLTGLIKTPVPLAAGTDWTNAYIDRASLSG